MCEVWVRDRVQVEEVQETHGFQTSVIIDGWEIEGCCGALCLGLGSCVMCRLRRCRNLIGKTSISTGGWEIEGMLGCVMFGFGIVCTVQVLRRWRNLMLQTSVSTDY